MDMVRNYPKNKKHPMGAPSGGPTVTKSLWGLFVVFD